MFDGYINTATLKKRFETAPLTECYAIRFVESDSYYMVIPIDGKRLILSTWRSEVAKPFRKAESLVKEAETFGFKSIKFGALEEDFICNKHSFVCGRLSDLEYWLILLTRLGVKFKLDAPDSTKVDTAKDDGLGFENDSLRSKLFALIKKYAHFE